MNKKTLSKDKTKLKDLGEVYWYLPERLKTIISWAKHQHQTRLCSLVYVLGLACDHPLVQCHDCNYRVTSNYSVTGNITQLSFTNSYYTFNTKKNNLRSKQKSICTFIMQPPYRLLLQVGMQPEDCSQFIFRDSFYLLFRCDSISWSGHVSESVTLGLKICDWWTF